MRNEQETRNLPPITRTQSLYMPYGNLPYGVRLRNDLPAHSNVLFHWFCANRPEPVAPYHSLILGYANLSPTAQDLSRALVDEMLSGDEFQKLKSYLLRRHNEDTRTTMVTTPIFPSRSRSAPRKADSRPFLPYLTPDGKRSATPPDFAPVSAITVDVLEDTTDREIAAVVKPIERNTSGFYALCEEEGYDLPFAIWGFYGPSGSSRI